MESSAILNELGYVPLECVKDREIIQGSLQRLLYGSAERPDAYKDIIEANQLRLKLRFIISVVEGWVSGGGLGRLSRPTDFKWEGPQMAGRTADWVTVGRYGGDAE